MRLPASGAKSCSMRTSIPFLTAPLRRKGSDRRVSQKHRLKPVPRATAKCLLDGASVTASCSIGGAPATANGLSEGAPTTANCLLEGAPATANGLSEGVPITAECSIKGGTGFSLCCRPLLDNFCPNRINNALVGPSPRTAPDALVRPSSFLSWCRGRTIGVRPTGALPDNFGPQSDQLLGMLERFGRHRLTGEHPANLPHTRFGSQLFHLGHRASFHLAFFHVIVMVGKAGDLRQMRHAQNLAGAGELFQAPPHRLRHAPTDACIH